ncbi:hypothetical protein FIBSPDRAFT_725014, partial [Athelia psychrophila]
KDGIGKCTVVNDCVAEGTYHFMFLELHHVLIGFQGYCKGILGRFEGYDARFHSKHKKPVIIKRSSTSKSKAWASNTSPSPSFIPTDERRRELSALRVIE